MYSITDQDDNIYGYSTNDRRNYKLHELKSISSLICDIKKTKDRELIYLTRPNKSANIQVTFQLRQEAYTTNIQGNS